MRKYTINAVKTERYTSSKNKGKKSQNKNLIFSNPESVLDNGENKINISDMRQQSQAKNISIQNNLNKKIKNHTFYESKYLKNNGYKKPPSPYSQKLKSELDSKSNSSHSNLSGRPVQARPRLSINKSEYGINSKNDKIDSLLILVKSDRKESRGLNQKLSQLIEEIKNLRNEARESNDGIMSLLFHSISAQNQLSEDLSGFINYYYYGY